jgi:hypothetical protein
MPKLPRRIRRTASGTVLPREGDGRTLASRRIKSLTVAFEEAIGSDINIIQRSRVAAAVMLSLTSEQLQNEAARGLPVDPQEAARVAEGLAKTLRDLERAKRPASRARA